MKSELTPNLRQLYGYDKEDKYGDDFWAKDIETFMILAKFCAAVCDEI